ncbi:glyoxylase-like metal-dependent hydrolase (beta-lactamase superfamily II) [Neorhizobium galegae]|uniref:MBL fold metallo-hydrolase n=1 Tax=Neorhizobium galegae TaxID=399 RepID=UPI001AE2FAF9|nr:MBL fold metallo-hydrolase [Neorhizobium galegae]MBP2547329.1 glyoxylase-like metal-dependent hydrolase (beta-lactamase superfamily II) [Neorhizobium galegae]
MTDLCATLRILEPYPGLYAYYDGRIAGKRLHSPERNWLDDGAYALGIASYALVSGDQALVYDTHMSLSHARAIRTHLEAQGVSDITVILSHWHTDHIAGNAVFADCQIIANRLTLDTMTLNAKALAERDPPIHPLILPNRIFEDRLELALGDRPVHLLQFDIHSADGTVLWLPAEQLLLAGDTLEDTITYISEPLGVDRHIAEIGRLAALPIQRILPNHGSEQRIAAGGYGPDLIDANRVYLERLTARIADPALDETPLSDFVAAEIASGSIDYFAPYETVHRDNIEALRTGRSDEDPPAPAQ